MKQYFNFESLIGKYESTFTLVTTPKDSYDDAGDLIIGVPTRTEKKGAIIGIRDYKVYRSEGVLTAQDKELHITESLGDITNSYILFEGDKYKIEENPAKNGVFTGVWSYTLKFISAFGEEKTDD